MADKLKVELQDENGNIYYLHTSADVVFCEDGTTVEAKLNGKIDKADIIQNATTAATDKVPSAAVAKNLQDQITAQNTKIAWTKLHEGVRAITDNSTPWHPTLTFASFDIVIMDVIMQNHHKMIPFYVGHVDNQTFVDSWGYRFANDDVHRMVTLSFEISGRYFSDVGAKMLYGNSYQWADCLSSIYIDAIWGLNCIN